MYHLRGPEADHRWALPTRDLTNTPHAGLPPSHDQATRDSLVPECSRFNAQNVRLPQPPAQSASLSAQNRRPPKLPSDTAPPLRPGSPHSLAPQWGARPRSPPHELLSLGAPEMLSACPPAPSGLGASTPRPPPPGPLSGPLTPSLRLATQPTLPGGQATPRLLGLPGSSDHPAPAPPREMLRRPQGSLGKLKRRRLE